MRVSQVWLLCTAPFSPQSGTRHILGTRYIFVECECVVHSQLAQSWAVITNADSQAPRGLPNQNVQDRGQRICIFK